MRPVYFPYTAFPQISFEMISINPMWAVLVAWTLAREICMASS